MRNDPKEAAEDELGDSEWLLCADEPVKPGAVIVVALGVLSVGVDEDVYVRKDQRSDSISSTNAALSSRSTPGCSPSPANVGSSVGGRFPDSVREKELLTASPTTSLSERPSLAARSFASASKSSGRSTVVRMHQSVAVMHQDARPTTQRGGPVATAAVGRYGVPGHALQRPR